MFSRTENLYSVKAAHQNGRNQSFSIRVYTETKTLDGNTVVTKFCSSNDGLGCSRDYLASSPYANAKTDMDAIKLFLAEHGLTVQSAPQK